MVRASVLTAVLTGVALLSPPDGVRGADRPAVRLTEKPDHLEIETDLLRARINKEGYVSGVAAGSLLDKKTGARDLGFGLHIMDFLLAPGWRDDGYTRDPKLHGNLPKHYVEGPQICTQARRLRSEVVRGKDFLAVRLRFRFTQPARGFKAGSQWEQTLVFQPGVRYVLSSERITSANDVDDLFYRIDMPGHIKHRRGNSFSQVYLSYYGKIPASALAKDFGPDVRYLYRREQGKIPRRMIRAYQVKVAGKPGPWLAGMTVDPAEVSEAWCHQRGYVCMIEELHRKNVRAGESFGAAYVVGFFDGLAEMEKVYDRYKGADRIVLQGGTFRLEPDRPDGRKRASAPEPLAGTQPLPATGDLAFQMVAGIDQYLRRELAASVARRRAFWKPDYASAEAFERSVRPNRERLRKILGVVDRRLPVEELEYVDGTRTRSVVAEVDAFTVRAVRWPVLPGVTAEGLLLDPRGKIRRCVVALPDADWTPEMLAGVARGLPPEAQFARRLAENGCRVLVPTLIDRRATWSANPRLGRLTNQPHREFIYRMSYELGRHIIGYEVQKVLAAVDWFTRAKDHPPVGVVGYGEGGLLALYSAALDRRIGAAVVSGYFGPREELWQEPIYRNVWALLREFGDAELAMLMAPRRLVIETTPVPDVKGPPAPRNGRGGAAPGRLQTPSAAGVGSEAARATAFEKLPSGRGGLKLVASAMPGSDKALAAFLGESALADSGKPAADQRKHFDPAVRQRRQFDELVEYTQKLLRGSAARRQDFFWKRTNLSSPAAWEKSTAPLRAYFWEEVIGKLPAPTLPANPRTRLAYDEPKWKGYEVTLGLYSDVFAYGILLVPKDLKKGERRPVVVCQHGLEGRPQDVVNPRQKTPYYNSFGAQLADRGYVVYAPQNPYIGQDRFRVLQRMANPLGLSLFSFIVRQHERTLDWLAGLPFVDARRLAFYGLSYGGKTAMRVPAILRRYCLSICSGDFNEWIHKNVAVDFDKSYMFTVEYEMFEFDLGNTFNYAEMAGLIAPRPFMVERGHDDPVGIDEWVAFEYAKVRRLYAKLGLPGRTAIEFFPGGHMINGRGTFAFLDKHLKGPK
jgi:dienelactone hydrolase